MSVSGKQAKVRGQSSGRCGTVRGTWLLLCPCGMKIRNKEHGDKFSGELLRHRC